jgi:hypothetical protein
MKSSYVFIDYTAMGKAMSQYVRKKASNSNSTIVYMKNDLIIEEDPKRNTQVVFKKSLHKKY